MMKNLFLIISLLVSGCKVFGQDDKLKLNHIYFILDSTSFEQIKASQSLRDWANMDKGLPNFDPVDKKSTTVYLRGRTTYLEIMGPQNKFGEKEGSIGIGFSWDVNGVFSDNIDAKLKKKGLKFERSESKWDFGNEKILWYSSYYATGKGSIGTWYAFYNPVFLTHLYQRPYTSFRREDFLESKIDISKEIKDLGAITLDCSIEDYRKISEELTSFGVKVKASDKHFIIFGVDSVEIKLNLTRRKISVIKELRLKTQSKLTENLKIGKLELESSAKELLIKLN
ncbi:DUF5829 family protein [Chryseobacterium vrystaatense]|uniref:Uncharacterized protein n=1 Tax=Chryseobacterium vrystaatense TaxID=307480 RepID=A0A1M5BMC4_9FLAO|nr:DUF5829 family protein [Chryseobacterium vrystaatense]SHF43540.1 hypothetical protein SAMN02787073_2308 [Chryseobacterium vrystaatense]